MPGRHIAAMADFLRVSLTVPLAGALARLIQIKETPPGLARGWRRLAGIDLMPIPGLIAGFSSCGIHHACAQGEFLDLAGRGPGNGHENEPSRHLVGRQLRAAPFFQHVGIQMVT